MMWFAINGKSFGGKAVLAKIELELHRGEITALLGSSGIGKSTLLRIIAGLEQDDARTRFEALKLGFVFQEPRLLPWKTALQNVELVGAENGLLKALGVEAAAGLYPRQLSLGMARRVAIARALAAMPELLILDEPFASLDAESAQAVRKVIANMADQSNLATLLVTHDRAEAQVLAKRIYTLVGAPAVLRRDQ